jgi:hypothetical protein
MHKLMTLHGWYGTFRWQSRLLAALALLAGLPECMALWRAGLSERLHTHRGSR